MHPKHSLDAADLPASSSVQPRRSSSHQALTRSCHLGSDPGEEDRPFVAFLQASGSLRG